MKFNLTRVCLRFINVKRRDSPFPSPAFILTLSFCYTMLECRTRTKNIYCPYVGLLSVTFSELRSRGRDIWPKISVVTEITIDHKVESIMSTCVSCKLIIVTWIWAGFPRWHGFSNSVRLNRPHYSVSVHLAVLFAVFLC